MAMRAVVTTPRKAGSVRLEEVPTPKPRPNEILVRVLRVGVDATDLDIAAGLLGHAPPGQDYLVMGHESVGVVEAVGPDARGAFQAGDPVVATVRRPCSPPCSYCARGQSDLCSTLRFLERGIFGLDGYWAEWYTESPECLVPVPPDLADVAVLTEPMSIVVKAVEQSWRAQAGIGWEPHNALVLGAGPIGLLATALLRLRALSVWTAATRSQESLKAQLVRQMGAEYINVTERPIPALENALPQLDFILEATGSSAVTFEAIGVLGANGVLCVTGVSPGDQRFEVPADRLNMRIMSRNCLVIGSVNSNVGHFGRAVQAVGQCQERWPGLLGRMLTRTVRLEECEAALEKDREAIKTVVQVSSPWPG